MIDLESMERISLSEREYWNYTKRSPFLIGVLVYLAVIFLCFDIDRHDPIAIASLCIILVPFWFFQRNHKVVYLDDVYLYFVGRESVTKIERSKIQAVELRRDRSYAKVTLIHSGGAVKETSSFLARRFSGEPRAKKIEKWKALKERLLSKDSG